MAIISSPSQGSLGFSIDRNELHRKASDPFKVPPTLGIDFGAQGGLVFNLNGDLYLVDMPSSPEGILAIIRQSCASRAYGEDVHAFPGQGVTSVATFMRGAGFIDGALCTLGIRFQAIPPQTWTKWYDIGKSSDFRTTSGKVSINDWKKHLKAHAEMLFPEIEVTKNCADALLIWNYATQLVKPPTFK